MQIVYFIAHLVMLLFSIYGIRAGIRGRRYNAAHPENADYIDTRVANGFLVTSVLMGISAILFLIAGLGS